MDNETNGQDKKTESVNYMAGVFQTHAENLSDSLRSAVVTGVKCAGIVLGALAAVAAVTTVVVVVASAVGKKD